VGANRSGVADTLGGSAREAAHAGRDKGEHAAPAGSARLKGNVYARSQNTKEKRTVVRAKKPPPPSDSSSNDDDDFVLVPFGPAATARRQPPMISPSAGPRTRGSANRHEQTKKATVAGKRAVTFKVQKHIE
jgi:hypothetical protein